MRRWWLVMLVLVLCGVCSAVPTTLPATAVGNNNFTISATGCVGTTHFEYGIYSDILMVWTAEYTPTGAGDVTHTEIGMPIEPSMTYYVAACDSTGCGNTVSFTTTEYTPLPVSTLGAGITNLTRTKFNVLNIVTALPTPYAWLFPQDQRTMALTLVFGVMFFFIYVGFWFGTRGVAAPVLIGLLTASLVLFPNQGLHLGIPVEFQAIAQALLYASIAGIFLIFMKR